MENKEFARFRKNLKKTQKELSQLLGTSLKAIHSYEQGWRKIPPSVERQMFFLVANKRGNYRLDKPCWQVNDCAPEQRGKCPAWEFQNGEFCWFISGTICEGEAQKNWEDKMKMCRSCRVLKAVLNNVEQ
jgi:hypothetical protein